MPCRPEEQFAQGPEPFAQGPDHSMLLEMVGPDESIRVSKNQSYAMRIATDFEVPGRCFEWFVFLWLRSLIRAIDYAE